jgi:hypothetical protein
MTIQYINTGSSANAGNGDSLRSAFIKVNNNFSYLSTASFGGGGGGYTGSRGSTGTNGYTGSAGINGYTGSQGPTGSINDLSDVIIQSPQSNDYLKYVGGTWTNSQLSIQNDPTPRLGNNLDTNGYTIQSNLTGSFIVLKSTATGIALQGPVIIGSPTQNIDGSLYISRNTYSASLLDSLTFAQHHDSQDAINFNLYRTRGTSTSILAVQDGDDIADLNFIGHDGTSRFAAATITVTVDGAVSPGIVPGKIFFDLRGTDGVIRKQAELNSSGTWKIDKLSHLSTTTSSIVVSTNLIPSADVTYDLGSTSSQWRSLYVGTSTIYLGGVAVSIAGGNLTINGNPVSASTSSSSLVNGTWTLALSTAGSILLNGTVFSGGAGSATTSTLINGTKTVSLGSTGVLSLPAQAVPLTTVSQITTASINRIGASTDTDAIAAAQDLWFGYEQTWVDLRDQDAATIAPATRTWAGLPSWEAYPLILAYTSGGGTGVSSFPSTTNAAKNAYLVYKELASNIDIVSGDKVFSFENSGVLRVPGVITKDNSLILQSSGVSGVLPTGNSASINPNGNLGRVFIRTDNGTTLRTWQFDIDGVLALPGNLTFPDLTVQTTAWTGSVSSLVNSTQTVSLSTTGNLTLPLAGRIVNNSNTWTFSSNGNTIFPTGLTLGAPRGVNTVNFTCAVDKEFQIETGTTSTGKLWQFGTTGNTTFPGNLQLNGGKIILNTGGNAYVESVDYGVNTTTSAVNIFGGPYQKIKLRAGFGTEAYWTFGTDSTLTLPAGGTITEGGGLTGAIKLTPAGGANAYQALLIYPTAAGDGDHVHLTAGGGATELYLGDDSRYVKLVNGGNVEIRATTTSSSASAAWSFGTDGAISTTDPLIINVPNGIPTGVGAIASTTGSWEQNPASNLATTGGSGTGLRVSVSNSGGYASAIAITVAGTGYLDGELITVTSGGSSASFIIAVTGTINWTFGTDGGLTLPNGAVLKDTVDNAIAFGYEAGETSQGLDAIAIGKWAGETNQGLRGIAIGFQAGWNNQQERGIAIGSGAGVNNQGAYAIAIGQDTSNINSGANSIAIGQGAGGTGQGEKSIAIGFLAGVGTSATFANSIILNASGGVVTSAAAGFFVAPVRNQSGASGVVQYNATTKEVSYSNNVTAESFNTDQITVVGNRIATTVTNANLELECNGTGGVVINTVAEATTASTTRSVGYLGMPQNAKSSSANTVIGDQGKHIYITGPTTITIDGSLAYPIGTTITFINSTSTATIAITTDTMVLGGVGTTGSRSLAPYGMATAVKVAATTWYINGTGLT